MAKKLTTVSEKALARGAQQREKRWRHQAKAWQHNNGAASAQLAKKQQNLKKKNNIHGSIILAQKQAASSKLGMAYLLSPWQQAT